MGTDISMYMEVKKEDGWEFYYPEELKEKALYPDTWDGDVYQGRNSTLFGILSEESNLISSDEHAFEAKGLPSDIDSKTKKKLGFDDYSFGTSWLTVEELYDFEWDKTHRKEWCYINPEGYLRLRAGSKIQELKGSVKKYYKPSRIVSAMEMEKYVNKVYVTSYMDFVYGDQPWIKVGEKVSYKDDCYHFYHEVIPYLNSLNNSFDDIRIVFTFDN